MRYIKTFEINKPYKDYMVWQTEIPTVPQNYYIFKLITTTTRNVHLYGVVSYLLDNDYNKKEINFKDVFRYSHDQCQRQTIFQSNDLKECEDYVEQLIQTNKYNL